MVPVEGACTVERFHRDGPWAERFPITRRPGGFGVGPGDSQPTTFVPSGIATGGGIASQDTSSARRYTGRLSRTMWRGAAAPPMLSHRLLLFTRQMLRGGAINFNGTGNLAADSGQTARNTANGGSSQFGGQASGGGLAVERAGSVTIADSVLQSNLGRDWPDGCSNTNQV